MQTPYQGDALPLTQILLASLNGQQVGTKGRGRDASCLAPPAQIRTCSFPAYGSYLGYETANRLSGQG